MTAFYAFLFAVVGGVISSLLTTQLSFWQFHSEKWWEKKAEIYEKLIEYLFNAYDYSDTWLTHRQESREYDTPEQEQRRKDKEAEAQARGEESTKAIRKLRVIGDFMLSRQVIEDLDSFREGDLEAWRRLHAGDLDEAVEMFAANAKKHIDLVREHAKEDLGKNRKWLQLH